MFTTKKICFMALLLAFCTLLCACAQNPSEEALYAKLLGRFTEAGFSPRLVPVPDNVRVGIADASRWQQLLLGEETVLVYFDESNRADYLKNFVDPELFASVTRFGQRFILTYNGTDEMVLALLKQLDQQAP